jgi:hypothetical protein
VVVEIRFKDFTDDALGYVKFIYTVCYTLPRVMRFYIKGFKFSINTQYQWIAMLNVNLYLFRP